MGFLVLLLWNVSLSILIVTILLSGSTAYGLNFNDIMDLGGAAPCIG